tara:strand:- start:282 stop:1979 length:1698 start_codon:yes stop_codon:yes gene_type:complete
MSQRQVNLKPDQSFANKAVQNVNIVTQTSLSNLANLAKTQVQQRKETEKALMLGSAKADQLIESYSDQTKDATGQMKVQSTAYVTEQAREIGILYGNSIKPGATQEDRDLYTAALVRGKENINAIATTVLQVGNNTNIPTRHTDAVKNGSALNRLTREAQQQTKYWNFQSVLGTGQFKDLKIGNDANGQVNISAKGLNEFDKDVNINASAFNNALLRTGETSEQQVIQQDEIINERGSKWFKSFEDELKGIPGLMEGVKKVESKYNRGENKKTVIQSEGPVNIYENLTSDPNNKQILIGKTTASNFNKTWDQLEINGYLGDGPLKDISWNTFNNKNVDVALKNLNATYQDTEGAFDPTPDDGKFTVDDYEKVQGEMRNLAADGMAKLAETIIGSRSETVVSIKELDDYYKVTNKTTGKSEYTPSGKTALRKDYKNLWDNKVNQSIVSGQYNGFDGIIATVKANKKAFGIDTTKGFDVMTGSEIRGKFPGVDFGTMQDEVLYEFNKNNPQNYDVVTKPEYFDFDANGGLDDYGKQTMWNLLGVDDYEQSIFNNPTEKKALNLKPSL